VENRGLFGQDRTDKQMLERSGSTWSDVAQRQAVMRLIVIHSRMDGSKGRAPKLIDLSHDLPLSIDST
jgi:hypothetical protein